MANIDAPSLELHNIPDNVFGNQAFAVAKVTIPADAAIGDVVRFLKLPRGIRLVDLKAVTDGAATAAAPASTVSFGIAAAADGAHGDAALFATGKDLAAAAVVRADEANFSVLLDDDDYYLTATVAGAVPGAATDVEVTLAYGDEGLL